MGLTINPNSGDIGLSTGGTGGVSLPEFYVADYGALFDGTTDDLAAVQAAVDAANAVGGGIVIMPSGTGRFQGALNLYPGIHLKGQGKGATTWSTLDTSGALTGSYAIKLNSGADDYITIEGFELVGQGQGDTSGYGIYDSTGVNSFVVIKDLYVREFPDDGIYLNDPILSSIEGCWLRDNGRDGLFIEVGTTCYLSYIYASGNERAGIHLKTHVSSTIDNCACEYNTANFWIESSGNITLNSPYVELTMRGDGGTLGYAAAYRIQSAQNIVINGGYSNSFAYLSGVPAYHLYITGSSRIILNGFRGKALASAEGGLGEAPTNTILTSTSTVHANNINFTDLTGSGQSGTLTSEIKDTGVYEQGGVVVPTISSTDTLTNKTLTAPKFANAGFIADADGNEQLQFNASASAVNHVAIQNGATGFAPSISAVGDDTNITLYVKGKGTGSMVIADGNSAQIIEGTGVTSAVNYTVISNSATGNAVSQTATGSDTNISINMVPKGTGRLQSGGVTVPTISSTDTLTNKRVTKRVGTTTSSATPTINTDDVDMHIITAQTVDITSFTTNLSGTPTEGQTLWIAITGTAARAITWGASFEASTVALPTTTVTTNRLDVGFVWNSATSKWRCIASA